MELDPIVAEVRAIREEFGRDYGHDLDAIVAALQRQEVASGRPVVNLSPKNLRPLAAEPPASVVENLP